MKIAACLFACYVTPSIGLAMNHTLIDFNRPINKYMLISDSTERSQGKSHGVFDFQSGLSEKKHYFFAYLDPQPNGAAFVSMYIPLHLELTPHQQLCLVAQGLQKQTTLFQLVIKTSASDKNHIVYYQDFEIKDEKITRQFPLKNFLASYRGKSMPQENRLDPSTIQAIGIRIIGRSGAAQNTLQAGLYGLSLYTLSICPS